MGCFLSKELLDGKNTDISEEFLDGKNTNMPASEMKEFLDEKMRDFVKDHCKIDKTLFVPI